MKDKDYRDLLPWASPKQRSLVELMVKESRSHAEVALGLSKLQVRRTLEALRKRAARHGYAPGQNLDKPTPEGFSVSKTTTQYNGEGEVTQQWIKNSRDSESRTEALLAAMEGIAEPIRGKSIASPKPKDTNKDLLCVYPMGDPHLGMLAIASQTGAEFDLEIAEGHLVSAVDALVTLAPAAKEALIINLGDFFHSDNSSNRTARSGATLEVSAPWAEVMRVGLRTMRRCIDRAAAKHEKVTVICEIGNHDDHSAVMLAMGLDAYYENNPRVVIDTSPMSFHWYRFGVNLIGTTHGQNTKPADLPGVMATDRARDWGETDNSCRYWYTGHVHHDSLKEYRGCVVETFRTLAAKDSWHHSKGYRAGRDMKCDVIHRQRGRINRFIVGVEQLEPK